ncbi:MAG: hypothetical protein ACT4OE_02140, partial [Sphingosinicella sp.]
MAKRGTKAYDREYTHVVYGIHRLTKTVKTVWMQRHRVLSAMGPDATFFTHAIKPGWTAENEAALVFGLSDTFSVPAELSDSEFTKKRVEELREKAARMSDEEATPPSPPA